MLVRSSVVPLIRVSRTSELRYGWMVSRRVLGTTQEFHRRPATMAITAAGATTSSYCRLASRKVSRRSSFKSNQLVLIPLGPLQATNSTVLFRSVDRQRVAVE